MSQHSHIPEKILAEIWKEQRFASELFDETGEKIEVQYVGDENLDKGGPDFINARIKVGNLTFVGDVEIDNTRSDWRNHGHYLNRRFNKVILHAIVSNESNQKFVYTQNGRRINTFCFAPHVQEEVLESLKKAMAMEDDSKTNKLHCYKVIDFANEKEVLNFVSKLGISRFKKKCDKLIIRIRELLFIDSLQVKEPAEQYAIPEDVYTEKLCYDDLNKKHIWEQLFYELIFEALGYPNNKDAFNKITRAVTISQLQSLTIPADKFVEVVESIFFSISGMIPDVDSIKNPDILAYVRIVTENMMKYYPLYDGERLDAVDWHFFRLRPLNFPTIRLAAGARLVEKITRGDLIGHIMTKFYEIHDFVVLKKLARGLLIVKSDGHWKKHYTFEKPAKQESIHFFLGTNRADEMFVNVVLPFAYVYFDLFGKPKFANKVLSVYRDVACEVENALVTEAANALHIETDRKKSVIYQGILELFSSFCSKNRCEECSIGKIVFSDADEPRLN